MADPIRKLAAIMFTDIAGFTALSSQDEEEALALLDKQREILKPIVEKHKGDWLKEIGDGLLLSFPSSKEAVNCAIEIQHILKEVKNLDLRIGIHRGDILEKGGDIFGDDVNIASRMEPFAAVGGVAISHKVAGDISGSPEFKLKLIGEPKLKGVKQRVRIYCITSHNLPETDISKVSAKLDSDPTKFSDQEMDEYLRQQKRKSSSKAAKQNYVIYGVLVFILFVLIFFPRFISDKSETDSKSIAVLPFTNFSDNKEDEYFSDGVHDDILGQLSKIHDLKVISRTSVMQYKNTTKTVGQIAEELNVLNILEGSVRRAGNKIRIVTQLINAVNDEHLWSETYDRDYADIFTIQSDVAQKIASALKATLTPEEKVSIEKKPTDNMEAYNLVLKGNYYWQMFTPEGFQKATESFEQALQKDPNYALAYTELASLNIALTYVGGLSPNEGFPQVKEYAMKALKIDNNIASAHELMAWVYFNYDYNWAAAERELKLALQLNPNFANTYIGYVYFLLFTGNTEKAVKMGGKALELDPLNSYVNTFAGSAILWSGQFDKAIEEHKMILMMHPNAHVAQYQLGMAYRGKSMFKEAIVACEKAVDISGGRDPMAMAFLAAVYYDYGKKDKAKKIIDSLKQRSKDTYVPPICFYLYQRVKGDNDKAFEWLERACNERDTYLPWAKTYPIESWRIPDEPRFKALLKKVGLE